MNEPEKQTGTDNDRSEREPEITLFEWSAIHLGAGLADDYLRKQNTSAAADRNGWEPVDETEEGSR